MKIFVESISTCGNILAFQRAGIPAVATYHRYRVLPGCCCCCCNAMQAAHPESKPRDGPNRPSAYQREV